MTLRRLALAASLALVLAALAGGCSNMGEGERCDPNADNNGNSDCNDGLVCTMVASGSVCCPANRQNATTSVCALGNSGIGGDAAPPAGDGGGNDSAGDASGGDAGGDSASDSSGGDGAGDATGDATDAAGDGASDAAGGG